MPLGLSLRGRRWTARNNETTQPRAADAHLVNALSEGRNLRSDMRWDATNFLDTNRYCERLLRAVEKREKIGVFGDYDCDGVTSTALLVRFLRRRGIDPVIRLPHRVHDGYGLKQEAMEFFHAQGVQLLLMVDTGVHAHEPVAWGNAHGIDTLIIDHHHPPAEFPSAVAIIHPARTKTPIHDAPAAATLTFMMVDHLERGEWQERDIDLVLGMLGTIADVMPLTAENRILTQQGLRAIGTLPMGPVLSLLQTAAPSHGIWTSTDIAFRVAPRINAAGRMDNPLVALEALLEGGDSITTLTTLNTARQDVLEELLTELLTTLGMEGDHVPETLPPLIMAIDERFSHGLLGLLAGKITERTGRPSLIGTMSDGVVTASLRSPACYHITEGLGRFADAFISFGGHAQAAGCSFKAEHIDSVREQLCVDVRERCSSDELYPTSYYDIVLLPSAITLDTVRALKSLEPFGPGNPEPRFILPNAELSFLRTVGSDQSHLQAKLGMLPVIGFGLAHTIPSIKGPVDLLVRLGENTWNERTTPQLILEDIRVSN